MMSAKNLSEDLFISKAANTKGIGHVTAAGLTDALVPGENLGRNPDDTTRVSAGAVLGYARVSRTDQNLERQLDALQEAGCNRIFQDHGVSGSKDSRPGLDEMLEYARPGDVIVVHALDRLGRNTRSLLALVESLSERQISLRILTLGVDTGTPAGLMVLSVMAALASLERSLLVERVHSGLEAARKRGRVGGRPPSLSDERKHEVIRMKAGGRTVAEIARLMVTSERTVRRVLGEAAAENES
jgi:DNA invertase Pin-like site-specific DNA recombinase